MSKSAHESTVVTPSGKEVIKDESLESSSSTVVISFSQPDSDNPFDWKPLKKWCVGIGIVSLWC